MASCYRMIQGLQAHAVAARRRHTLAWQKATASDTNTTIPVMFGFDDAHRRPGEAPVS